MKRGVVLIFLLVLFSIILVTQSEAVFIQSAISPIYVGETDTLLKTGTTDSVNWEILTPSICKFYGTDIFTNNQIRSYPKGLSAGTCSVRVTTVIAPTETATFDFQVLAAAAPIPASLSSCSVVPQCIEGLGKKTLASVSGTTDAHVSRDINRFPYKLCCDGESLSRSCIPTQPQKADVAYIYLTDDSHVDPNGQPESICLSVRDQSSISCRFSNTGCTASETCLLSLYQTTDSHVADCNALSTQTKICCSITQAKTCYNQGEARSDSDSLQCCVTDPVTGSDLYYSKEVDTDITGGCCVKVDEAWNSFTGRCEPTQATLCNPTCPYDPTNPSYWTTAGCFRDLPTPPPYEDACCTETLFGVTDKFQIPIEVTTDANGKCTGAKFCSSTTKLCSSTLDSFCPENYGDWSSCPLNEVGNRCSICDPDCGTCGSTSFSQLKDPASQNEQLTIKVEYNVPIVKEITLWRVISGTDYYISTANCQVQGSVCTATFSPGSVSPGVVQYLTTPSSPGSPYSFKSSLSVAPDIIITKTGYTLPRVEIQAPLSGSTLSGTVNIRARAQSDSSISNIKWYIEKKSSGANMPPSYSPVNIINNQGSCTFCDALGCNLLGSASYSPNPPNTNVVSTKSFNTLKCDNNDFMLKVIAEDQRGNKAEASIPVRTSNTNAPCTDNCPAYDSTILKIVIAKVKTWI
ncbi:Ig-like domain-containing protein [Candidatus Woesearchaeota archaeon]|nr:Ig-like domain-containing protein [Candidatus Woesearchaeota archaeon]